MALEKNNPPSQYQSFLPASLQGDPLLGKFLLGFEQILTGFATEAQPATIVTAENPHPPGLESIIDNIHLYFNPQETPDDFLPWLAGWVGLSLRDDWDVRVKREFIRQVLSLYQLRGTKAGLEKVLALYLKNSGFGEKVQIFEHFEYLPYYFQVQLTLPDRDPEKYWRQARIAKAIIDQEKPAHTFYTLKILVPTMQITKALYQDFKFTLLKAPAQRLFDLTITVTPDADNPEKDLSLLSDQLKVYLKNENSDFDFPLNLKILQDSSFQLIFKINHQEFIRSLDGFKITLSNQTDSQFIGDVAVDFDFTLNGQRVSNQIFTEPVDLPPTLRVVEPENQRGSSVIHEDRDPPGMLIPPVIFAEMPTFFLFDDPKIQLFTIDTQIVVESAIATRKEGDNIITDEAEITRDLMLKIGATIREQDSTGHLLSLQTEIKDNVISLRKIVTHDQFLKTIEGYTLQLRSLSLKEISGQVLIDVTCNLNKQPITHRILTEQFNLAALGEFDRMQICQRDLSSANGYSGNTILGTTSQAI